MSDFQTVGRELTYAMMLEGTKALEDHVNLPSSFDAKICMAEIWDAFLSVTPGYGFVDVETATSVNDRLKILCDLWGAKGGVDMIESIGFKLNEIDHSDTQARNMLNDRDDEIERLRAAIVGVLDWYSPADAPEADWADCMRTAREALGT